MLHTISMSAKWLIIYFVYLSSVSMYSQSGGYKEIHFTYERRSNYIINEKGVIADTLLFMVHFPGLKYAKHIHPNDSTICGIVPLFRFSDEEKRKLTGILYHANDRMKGTYNLKKNITTFTVERSDRNTSKIFKKYFQKGYQSFQFEIVVDYNKKTIVYNYPITFGFKEFDSEIKDVKFFDETLLRGSYTQKIDNFLFENIVIFEENLDEKILPDLVFSNNRYGVRKIKTIFNTIELTSISTE